MSLLDKKGAVRFLKVVVPLALILFAQMIAPTIAMSAEVRSLNLTENTEDENLHSLFEEPEKGVPISEPIDPDTYRCGAGDLFLISLWGPKEARFTVSISPEGILVIPTIGKVLNLVGKTLTDAKQAIRWKIGTVYSTSSYDVNLLRPRTFIVYVAGHAKAPGEHKANAVTRVSHLVKQAGGANAYGSSRFAEVWRNNVLVGTIDSFQLERFGEVDQDIYLIEGDIVKIPIIGRLVSVSGGVKVPGEYELKKNENLRRLIDVQCAGFSLNFSSKDPIEIVRREQTEQLLVRKINSNELAKKDIALQDQDRIYVPTLDRYQKVIRIQGAVVGKGSLSIETKAVRESMQPSSGARGMKNREEREGETNTQVGEYIGVYPFIEGETVSKVIERAGGVLPNADTNNTFIRRPESGRKNVYKTLRVDLTAILIEKDYSKDIELEAGDFLIVPSLETSVFVTGEVTFPGPKLYSPYFNARYYVGMAGGKTSRASFWKSKIIHPNGAKEKLDSETIIQPGDTIHLEEKSFKFWQDYWTILTGGAAIILSGFAVMYAYETK